LGRKSQKGESDFFEFHSILCLDTPTVCYFRSSVCDHLWHRHKLSYVCSNQLAGCRLVSLMLFRNLRFKFSGLLLPLLGFMCGCFSSILLRQTPEDVTAIAIETGVQNTGIAIMLLKVRICGIIGTYLPLRSPSRVPTRM
jgi:hypothetical protein